MRTTIMISLIFLGCQMAFTQSPFDATTHVFRVGVGLGDKDAFLVNETPFIGLSYDQGIIDDLGIGNLAVGGLVGAKFFWDDALDGNWTRVLIAGRGTYHFHFVNSYNFDFYVGGMAGFFFWMTDAAEISGTRADFDIGAFAGIHYFFTETFGIYAEAGYGLGFLNAGGALKF